MNISHRNRPLHGSWPVLVRCHPAVAAAADWSRARFGRALAAVLVFNLAFAAAAPHGPAAAVADQPPPDAAAPPDDHYPEDRPDWLDEPPSYGEKRDSWTIVTPPLATPELAQQTLQVQLRGAAEAYLELLLDDSELAAAIQLSDRWIEERVSTRHRYQGEVFGDLAPRYEAAARLHFLPQDRQWLHQQANELRLQRRLWLLALVSAAGLGSLIGATVGLSLWRRRVELRS